METKEKSAFIIYDEEEAQAFHLLLKNSGIDNTIESYLGRKIIYVADEKYLSCLEMGTLLQKETNFKSIKWINAYNEPRPLGYLPLMYCSLPPRRRGDSLWEILNPQEHGLKESYCPIDIKIYLDVIKTIFGRDVAIKYNSVDNAIEVLIKADLSEYESLLKKCKTFNHLTFILKPFRYVLYMQKDGTVIQTEEKEHVDKTGMNSYLYQSMFFEGLAYPQGSNISPKTDDDNNVKISGFKSGMNSWGVRKFDVTSGVDNGTYKLIIGDFIVDIEKKYSYFWDAKNHREINLKKSETFTMIDNGNFSTQITVESPTDVTVDTSVKVIRNVVGYNYDGITIRDGYFGNKNHEDSRFDVRIREYFKMIKPDRLLHYSDNSEFVEIYDLPEGWTIADGLDKLAYPTVYDDTNFDELEKDEDYDVIKALLNSRQMDLNPDLCIGGAPEETEDSCLMLNKGKK